jgi:hypothetical protein
MNSQGHTCTTVLWARTLLGLQSAQDREGPWAQGCSSFPLLDVMGFPLLQTSLHSLSLLETGKSLVFGFTALSPPVGSILVGAPQELVP